MNEQIVKTYDLRIIGGAEINKELSAINKNFLEIRKNKVALNQLKDKVGDANELIRIKKELAELAKQEKALVVERKKKEVQLKELKILAEEEARATKRAAAEQIKEQRELNAESKKLQIEEKKRRAEQAQAREDAKKQALLNKEVAGSYNQISAEYKKLLNFTKNKIDLTNEQEVDAMILKLRQMKTLLDDFNRRLSSDGTLIGEYTTGIVNAFKRLGLDDLINNRIDETKRKIQSLDAEFDELKRDLSDIRVTGEGAFDKIEMKMIENRQQADQLERQLKEVQVALKGTGNIGEQITTGIRSGFKNLKQDIASFVVSYIGFQQLIGVTQRTIALNSTLSDNFTDLQRILQANDVELNKIIASLKEIETRTSLKDLSNYAIIAAKAGVATENIAGVVKAIDELQLVAGRELGDVDQTLTSLVKLVNIFAGADQVNEDNIRRFGNAIVDLANKGVATGEFLVDYSKRLAGVEGISKIQIASVLGLAAAFEEQGQSAEVAATATTQLLIKMSANVPKYAALAKVSEDAFRKLLRENPAEAFIQLAEGLKGSSDQLDDISANFADAEARGVRVTATLGVLGDKADYFRGKIKIANEALQDTTAITEGAQKKQENFAATINKVRKEFELIGSSKGVQTTLELTGKAILVLINNLPILIGLGALMLAGWIAQNTALVILNARLAGYIVLQRGLQLVYGAVIIAQTAYAVGMGVLTGSYRIATAAAALFNRTIGATPLGIILIVLGLTAAAFAAFAGAVTGNTAALKAHADALRFNLEVQNRANEATKSQIANIKTLTKVAGDNNASLEIRKKALAELIAINPAYLNGLTLENIKTAEGTKLLNEYIKVLRTKAELQAATAIRDEKLQRDAKLEAAELTLQGRVSTGRGIDFDDLTDDEKQFVSGFRKNAPFLTSLIEDNAAREALIEVQRQRKELKRELATADKVIEDKFKAVGVDPIPEGTATTPEGRTLQIVEKEIKTTKAKLKNAVKDSQEAIDLAKKLKALQKERKEILGFEETDKADRLSAAQRDAINTIDAERDTALANENIRYAKLKALRQLDVLDEIQHLDTLLSINTKAVDKKLAILKGGNAAEKKEVAELKLKKIEDQQKTNDEIYKLRLDDLFNQKQAIEQAAKEELDAIEGDLLAGDVEKAAAKANYFTTVTNVQKAYNQMADELDKEYGKQSEKNANDRAKALLAIQRNLNKALRDSTNTAIDNEVAEIDRKYDGRLIEIRNKVIEKAQAIFGNADLSPTQKKRRLDELEKAGAKEALNSDLSRVDEQIKLNQYLFDTKLINEKEYNKRSYELAEERVRLLKGLQDIELSEEEKKRQMQQRILSQFEQTFNAVTASYLQGEYSKIDADADRAKAYRDKEKQMRLDQATSEQERETIEEEFRQREEKADKDRNEARKEVAKKQLAIEFAVASIKAISTSLNIYEGFIKEGLVIAEYLAMLQTLENQQFARGGEVPGNGGEFGGRPHSMGGTKFGFGGRTYEAEAKELMIINKNSAQSNRRLSLSGTPKQIASAINAYGGGVNFAPGARMGSFEYGGSLGASVKPPVFSNTYNSRAAGDEAQLNQIYEMVYRNSAAIVAASNRIDNLRVTLNPNEVESYESSYNKAVNIATL